MEGKVKKILAVAASARRNGNSDILLEQALLGIQEASPGAQIERLAPYEIPITPCRSCRGCWETGRCVVKDPMQELYVKFSEVDHVVVASPQYFTSVPGHFKVMIDRFQCFWVRTYLLGEPPTPRRNGMLLCVGGMKRDKDYQCTLTLVKTWMSTLNMGCPVSRFYTDLDEPQDALKREDYLEDARRAGVELMRLAEKPARA